MADSIWVRDGKSWMLRFPAADAQRAIETFVDEVANICSEDHPDLRALTDWAYRLGADGLATLSTTQSTTWPAIRLVPTGAKTAMATVDHDSTQPHVFIKVWRSVYERVAPNSIARLESAIGQLGHSCEIRNPTRAQLAALRAAFREAGQEGARRSRTQRITAADLHSGRIRLPDDAKRLFPKRRSTIEVTLRGTILRARYDPRTGPDRPRSGVLSVGRESLSRIDVDSVLAVKRARDGSVHID